MTENKRVIVRLAIEGVFWLAMGGFFIFFLRCYGFPLGTKKLIVLIMFIIAATLIHIGRSRKTPGYMIKVLGIRSDAERTYEYDWLRILAVSMVIITHAVQMDLSTEGLIEDERAVYFLTVLYVFCLACNLIYVMLSGGLLLPYREERLSDFYLHRASKVLLPMFVYYIFYLWVSLELECFSLQTVVFILGNFFQGITPECPHYWLMYVILSIYVVVPFLRYMLRNMPYKLLTSMVAVCMIFMFFRTYCPVRCNVNPILTSWAGVAVFGYWMTRQETRRYDKYIVASGIAGLLVTMYYIKVGANFREICCNCSPTMMMISGGLFSLVFLFPKVFSRGNWVLSVLSKYSYSLILIHWTMLAHLTREKLHFFTNSYCYVGGIFLAWGATLASSLVVAFLIDNFVLVVMQQIYDFGVKRTFMRKRIG